MNGCTINNEIMLFSSTLVLRLLKMRFGVFKRPRRLIIKVCRHKCDLDRRLMNFSNVPANFVLISQAVLELQQNYIGSVGSVVKYIYVF